MPRKSYRSSKRKYRRSSRRMMSRKPMRLYRTPMKDMVVKFRDVSSSLTFNYGGTTTFYQPFRIGPTGSRLNPDNDQRNFASLYSSLNYMAAVFERYKISGCKLTCTITRTQSDDGKVPNDVPVCFETIDELGPWYDRVTQSWIPTFANNSFTGTELINDHRVRKHHLHNNVTTFNRWVPFTECAARTSQYTAADALTRDYLSNMSVEPVVRKPQWHYCWTPNNPALSSPVDFARYNHGAPFWWMMLVNASNAQTLKINYEYCFYVHYDDANFAPQLSRTAAPDVAVPQMGAADLPSDPRHLLQLQKALRGGGTVAHYGEAPHPIVVRHVEFTEAQRPKVLHIPDSAYVVEADDEVYEEKDDDDGYDMDSAQPAVAAARPPQGGRVNSAEQFRGLAKAMTSLATTKK